MTARPTRPQPANRPRRRRPSAAERAAARRRRRLRTIAWATAAVLVVGGAVGFAVARSQASARAVRALGVQSFANQGQQHLQPGQDYTSYNSTPPTSGPHAPAPAPCGVSSEPVPNTVQVHDLEHGVVMVQYRPGLDAGQVQALQALGRSYDSHVILAPYPGLPTPVTATAWTKLMRLDRADVGKLRRFIDRFRQHGPEASVACPSRG
jgi:Protein of unknown function (DUF3105)